MAAEGATQRQVAQGECLASLADAAGHLRTTISDANPALFQARANPYALLPGDDVTLPAIETKTEPVNLAAYNRFRLIEDTVRLRLRLRDMGTPLAQAAYRLDIGGRRIEGQTDADGALDQPIPAQARTASLSVEHEGRTYEYRLDLGAMDPIDSVSGLQARLSNLGYRSGPIDGVMGPRTEAALRRFQKDEGVAITGKPDAATEAAVAAQYGG